MEMVCSGNLNSYNPKTIEISKKFSAGEYPVSKNKSVTVYISKIRFPRCRGAEIVLKYF